MRVFALVAVLSFVRPTHEPLTARRTEIARARASETADSLAVFPRGLAPDASRAERTTVVLIPGPVGSAFSMRHITAALAAQGVPSVVIDPLGMGSSLRPEKADYTLTRQALRIAAVLDTLHVGRVLLVGQGTSATVALHLAADKSARVVGVISLAGGPVDQQGTKGVKLALTLAPLLDNAIGRSLGRRKFVGAVRDQSASDVWCTPEVVKEYLRPYEQNLRGSLRALRAMSESVEPAPIASRLPSVRAPVRLLVGDKKSANSPTDEQIRVLQRGLTQFRADTVRHAGTMLQEEGADAVLLAISEMLAASRLPAAQELRR